MSGDAPMTNERLSELKREAEGCDHHWSAQGAIEDLVNEVTRLRAEVERRHADSVVLASVVDAHAREREVAQLRAEVERLTSEHDGLRQNAEAYQRQCKRLRARAEQAEADLAAASKAQAKTAIALVTEGKSQ